MADVSLDLTVIIVPPTDGEYVDAFIDAFAISFPHAALSFAKGLADIQITATFQHDDDSPLPFIVAQQVIKSLGLSPLLIQLRPLPPSQDPLAIDISALAA